MITDHILYLSPNDLIGPQVDVLHDIVPILVVHQLY